MGEFFLQLLNRSITAGWLILAVLCVRLLFRKMPKWVNCLLWGAVALRLIVPFSVESALSLQPSAQPIRSSTVVGGERLSYVPSLDSGLSVVENTVNPILAEKFAYSEADSVAPLQVVAQVAGIVWVVGMILLLAFAWGSMIRLFLLIKESVRYKDNVYICDRVNSPFILGIIRPRIYLSSSLTEEEIEFILAHEKAHLKRKDHLWKPLGYLLLSIYWFNPLCLVAYIMLCRDIELACDEKVITDMSFEDKKEYSKVLLSCATQRRLVMVCPLAFGEVGVKERVKTVLNYKKPTFWITIAAIMVCAIIAVCFLTNPAKEYQIRITIPAGSETGFYYSDEEICPKRNTLTIAKGGRLGDTEVILLPVEVKEENAYDEPVYITAVAPAKTDVEKGAWFQIGVKMQNPTAEDIDVYVTVRDVVVRIASKTRDEYNAMWLEEEQREEQGAERAEEQKEEQTVEQEEGQTEKPEDVNMTESKTDSLNTAILNAIIEYNGSGYPSDVYHCASFVELKQELLMIDSAPPGPDILSVYGMALEMSVSYSEGKLNQVSGSHMPVVITFEVADNTYTMTDFWVPRDGRYYVSDIRDKFPDEIEEDALDTQKYVVSQIQECYSRAVQYYQVDTEAVIDELFDTIESSPATSSNPADYIDAHSLEYRELMYYGQYSLSYIFHKFMEGEQNGLRGQLMRILLDDLAPEAKLRLYAETGQEYFDEWVKGAEQVLEQHDMEWIKENQPAMWILYILTK